VRLAGLAAVLLLASGSARAAPPVAKGYAHTAPTTLEARARVVLEVKAERPAKVRRGRVRYRAPDEAVFHKVDMQLTGEVLRAEIPADAVQPPALDYYIVVQGSDGKVEVVVASAEAPQRVVVEAPGRAALDEPEDLSGEAEGSLALGGAAAAEPLKESVPAALEEAEGGESRGANVRGRLLPGGASLVDTDGDPFLGELAIFAAEDPASFIIEPPVSPDVPPETFSRVEREQIERMNARTLVDVLRIMPGVSISRDVLGYERVTLRGLRGDARLDVIVDGHRLKNPYDGGVPWDMPADLIETVEIVRAPLPRAQPVPAPFGVVRITTRQAAGLAWRVWGGSFGTVKTGGGAGLRIGKLSLFGAGHAGYTQGPRLPIEADSWSRTPFARDGQTTVADAATGALSVGADLDLGGGTRLYGRGLALTESRGPYIGAFDTVGETSRLGWTVLSGNGGLEVPLGELATATLGVYAGSHLVDRRLQVSPIEFGLPDRDGDGKEEEFPKGVLVRQSYGTMTFGLTAELAVRLFAGNHLKAGLATELAAIPAGAYTLHFNRTLEGVAKPDGPIPSPVDGLAARENGPCGFYGTDLEGLGACRATTTLYVGDSWQPVRGLYFDAGVSMSSFSDVEPNLLTHVNPHLGVSWTIMERLTLRAHAATGIRPPTFEERFDELALAYVDYAGGAYVGSPGLVPEAVRRAEAGADYRFALGDARFLVWGTGFTEVVQNTIERVDVTGNVEQPSNAGAWEMVGAEAGGSVRFLSGSSAFFNVSWLRGRFRAPKNLDPNEPQCSAWFFEGEGEGGGPCSLLTSVPQLRANLGMTFDLGLANLTTWAMLGSERRNNSRSTLERLRPFTIPPYALLNVAVRTRPLFDLVGLEASVFNVLDHSWRDDVPRPDRMPGLVPQEGISAYAGLYLQL
jgi:hypothetical protein